MTAFALGHVTERDRQPRHDRTWSFLAIASVVVAVVVSAKVALSATHPSFPYDEIDQLQMSRLLAGLDTPTVRGAGYFPAWAFILAPVWWFTSDALLVYGIATWTGLLIGLAAIVPLTFMARRFRITTAQSVVAASVVVTLPSVAIQADYALSERLVFLSVVLVVLAAWRLWERPGIVRAVVFGAAVGLMYFSHVRMAVIVIAAAIWLLLLVLHHWRAALAGLATLALLYVGVYQLSVSLNIELIGSFVQGENLGDTLSATRAGLLARTGFGQAWTQIVGTLGLAAVGAVGLAVLAWREIRVLRIGRAGFVLAIFLAAFLLSAVKWADEGQLYFATWVRIDTWLYGRYIDPLTSILVLAGVAFLLRGIRRSVLAFAVVGGLGVLVVGTYWVSLQAPSWGYLTAAHVPGITPWAWMLPTEPFADGSTVVPSPWNENRFWFWASACTAAAFALYALLRRRAKALGVLLIAAIATMTVVGDGTSDDFHDLEGGIPSFVEPLRDAVAEAGGGSIAFATGCSGDGAADSVKLNYYGYWLLPAILTTFDSRVYVAPSDADLIITCGTDRPEGADDAVMIPGSEVDGKSTWVNPGEIKDELEAEGALP